MKIYTSDEVKDRIIGGKGTKERDKFDKKVAKAVAKTLAKQKETI